MWILWGICVVASMLVCPITAASVVNQLHFFLTCQLGFNHLRFQPSERIPIVETTVDGKFIITYPSNDEQSQNVSTSAAAAATAAEREPFPAAALIPQTRSTDSKVIYLLFLFSLLTSIPCLLSIMPSGDRDDG